MNPSAAVATRSRRWTWWVACALWASLLCDARPAQAQESVPRWQELSTAEQRVLRPLQDQWKDVDATRKLKWRELAQRYPNLPPDQQARVRERMLEWARLSAAERNEARLRFQSAKTLPADERQAKWEAYKNLTDEQRRALAGKAQTRASEAGARATSAKAASVNQVQPKSNIVQAQSPPPSRSAGLGTVQAGVGASTRPINQQPQPPSHQLVGQPKIAATPEYVDRATLLPQHGPQASTEPRRASQ